MRKEKAVSDDILCAEYESVYRYVLSLCRNDAEAQDITQETFLKALKATDSFSGDSSLYTWLCSIAKNLWLNSRKKQKRQTDNSIDEAAPSGEPPLDELIAERDMSICIHRILHKLDEPYKEVFSLRVFGQLSFSDIAKLFSKTESWARVTYHRAKKMIIERLRKDGML